MTFDTMLPWQYRFHDPHSRDDERTCVIKYFGLILPNNLMLSKVSVSSQKKGAFDL